MAEPRKQCVIVPGYKKITASTTGTIQLRMPSLKGKQLVVEKIKIELTSLDATIEIKRSDEEKLVTSGETRASLLGAVKDGNQIEKYEGPQPFVVQKDCMIEIEVTDLSGADNECYVAVEVREYE